ncbi:small outer capsid protein [Serratia phage vB_SspM_LC53]|nr:small outer capsid protein [Serratia phage vB_SspM_LC53]
MGGYVNIKTFDHTTSEGEVKGKEVSIAFELYSDVHRIANAHYQTFPSETPAYATVFEVTQRDEWIAANEEMFKATPPEPEGSE